MTTEEGVDLDPMTSETGYGTDLDLANEKGRSNFIIQNKLFIVIFYTFKTWVELLFGDTPHFIYWLVFFTIKLLIQQRIKNVINEEIIVYKME